MFATVVTIILTGWISFTNLGPGHYSLESAEFIGFQQYGRIFTGAFSSNFVGVFGWTVLFASLTVVLAFFLGLFFATLLNNPKLRGRTIYRTLLIIPWALPAAITILAWRGILGAPSPGALNAMMGTEIHWLTDPWLAKFSVTMVNLWTAFPFMMCAALGALQSIPSEVHEAATIDGASRWRRFRHITLPLLRSAMLPVIIFTFAFHFSNFNAIFMLTEGGPELGVSGTDPGQTDILISYMYKLSYTGAVFHYGLAAAFGIILFIIIAAITLVNFKVTGAFKEVAR